MWAGGEENGIASLRWSRRWGASTDSQTQIVGLVAQAPLGSGFRLEGRFEMGRVMAEEGGAFGVADPLHTTAATISLSRGFVADGGTGAQEPIYGR
jgi:hypothetical protein